MIIADCISDFTTSYGLPVSLFLAGFVGGFTHCSAMCSPFVLGQVQGDMRLNRLRGELLLPYHLGRMVTYVGLAILFSSLINLAFLFSDIRTQITAFILMIAGLLFLVNTFPIFGKLFPWLLKLQFTKPFEFISQRAKSLMLASDVSNKFLLGVLLGFMPCGMVVAAIMAASTASSPLYSALAMASFAAGTMPALMLISLGSAAVKYKYPKIAKRVSQGAMMISAIWLFALAGILVF